MFNKGFNLQRSYHTNKHTNNSWHNLYSIPTWHGSLKELNMHVHNDNNGLIDPKLI